MLFVENSELDSLLAENNQLLDQLLSANGLDLPTEDLVTLPELNAASANMEYLQEHIDSLDDHDDLIADLAVLAEPVAAKYPEVSSPTSTVDTLPSEPSSPVDLLSLLDSESDIQHRAHSVSGTEQPAELDDLLKSLLDVNDNTAAPDTCYNEYLQSPTNSEQSYSTSYTDESWEDNHSTCSSEYTTNSQTPGKAKSKRKSKSTPYSKLPAGRKEKKKKQNKEAAIRYREKKKQEAKEIMGEEDLLMQRNRELKTEVMNLEREIMCMKELLSDVFNIHSL